MEEFIQVRASRKPPRYKWLARWLGRRIDRWQLASVDWELPPAMGWWLTTLHWSICLRTNLVKPMSLWDRLCLRWFYFTTKDGSDLMDVHKKFDLNSCRPYDTPIPKILLKKRADG